MKPKKCQATAIWRFGIATIDSVVGCASLALTLVAACFFGSEGDLQLVKFGSQLTKYLVRGWLRHLPDKSVVDQLTRDGKSTF